MPWIIKTTGVVLKRIYFRNTSKIVFLFTKDYGKLELLAKGALLPKSRFGGSLEPFAFSEVIFYRREGKERYLLSDATLLFDFRGMREDADRFYHASLVSDFLYHSLPKEESFPALYRLFLSTFYLLNREGKESLVYSFLLKAASLLGYRPNLFTCVKCHKVPNRFFFVSARGGFLCERCSSGEGVDFPKEAVRKLKELLSRPQIRLVEMELNEREKGVIRDFLAFHLNFRFANNPFSLSPVLSP